MEEIRINEMNDTNNGGKFMKKILKKILSPLLIVAFAFGFLSGITNNFKVVNAASSITFTKASRGTLTMKANGSTNTQTMTTAGGESVQIDIVLSDWSGEAAIFVGTLTYDTSYFTYSSHSISSKWDQANSPITHDDSVGNVIFNLLNVDVLIFDTGTPFVMATINLTTKANVIPANGITADFFCDVEGATEGVSNSNTEGFCDENFTLTNTFNFSAGSSGGESSSIESSSTGSSSTNSSSSSSSSESGVGAIHNFTENTGYIAMSSNGKANNDMSTAGGEEVVISILAADWTGSIEVYMSTITYDTDYFEYVSHTISQDWDQANSMVDPNEVGKVIFNLLQVDKQLTADYSPFVMATITLRTKTNVAPANGVNVEMYCDVVDYTEGVSVAIPDAISFDSDNYSIINNFNFISASVDSTLKGLSISFGTLSPAFLAETTDYTTTVPYNVSSLTVTPTVNDSAATVKVNNVSVSSSAASSSITLASNATTNISISVLAADNVTTKVYTIAVTRQANNVATLASINSLSGAYSSYSSSTNSLSGNSMTISDSMNVYIKGSTTSFTGIASVTSNQDISTSLTLNNAIDCYIGTGSATTGTITSGSTFTISMPADKIEGTFDIVVTAQDGTSKTYQINIYRKSNSTALSSVTVNSTATTLNGTTYSLPSKVTTSSAVINVTSPIAGTLISINSSTAEATNASTTVSLNVGSNTITILTTAQDGTTGSYTVSINRASSTTSLSSLTIVANGNDYTATNASNVYSNTTTSALSGSTNTINIVAAVAGTATIKIGAVSSTKTGTGTTTLASGATSSNLTISDGANYIPVTVLAEDGTTSTTYYVYVYRKSSDATLSALTVSAGSLSFASSTTTYNVATLATTTTTTVTPTVANSKSTVKVNGTIVSSGSASSSIALNSNSSTRDTTITVLVTAEDGTTKTYTIVVTRAAYTNATLASISLVGASSTFNSSTNSLSGTSLTIANSMPTYISGSATSFTITPTVTSGYNMNTTIALNNATNCYIGSGTLTSGSVSSGSVKTISIPLGSTSASFTMVVTAQDGTTTKTYTVNIVRKSNSTVIDEVMVGSSDITSSLSGAEYTLSGKTNSESVSVSVTAANSASLVKIGTNAATSGTATNNVTLVTGTNTINVLVTAEDGTAKTYTIMIYRNNTDASLSSVTINAKSVDYIASLSSNIYSNTSTDSLPNSADKILISATPASGATMAIGTVSNVASGIGTTPLASGVISSDINISVEDNYVPVTVTSESGSASTYYIHVYRNAYSTGTVTVTMKANGSTTDLEYRTDGGNTVAMTLTLSDYSASIAQFNGEFTFDTDYFTYSSYQISNLWTEGSSSVNTLSASTGSILVDLKNTTGYISASNNPFTAITINLITKTNTTPKNGVETNFYSNVATQGVIDSNGDKLNADDLNITLTSNFVDASNDATLSGLTLSAGTLIESFNPEITAYTMTVGSTTSSTTVTPTTSNNRATVKVNSSVVASGSSSSPIALVSNTSTYITVITIEVTAEDLTKKTYTVTVTRTPYAIASLASITNLNGAYSTYTSATNSLSGTSLTIADKMDVYLKASATSFTAVPTVTANYNIDSEISLTSTSSYVGVSTGTTGIVASGNAFTISMPISNMTGEVLLNVVAQDGSSKTYTLNIIRLSNSTSLTSVYANGTNVTSNYDSLTSTYTLETKVTTSTTTVVATTNDTDALIQIDSYSAVKNNSGYKTVAVETGVVMVTITVTAEDGTIVKYYISMTGTSKSTKVDSVIVSDDTNEYSTTLSSGTFTNSIHLAPSTGVVSIKAVVSDGQSMMIGTASNVANGTGNVALSSGTLSLDIPVSIGKNYIPLTVTAEDTVTKYTYYIYIYVNSNDATLSGLSISAASINPTFTAGTLSYAAAVSSSTTSTTVTPIVNQSGATIKVNGISVTSAATSNAITLTSNLSTRLTNIEVVVTAEDGSVKTYSIAVTRAAFTAASLASINLTDSYSSYNSSTNALSNTVLTVADTMNAYIAGSTTSFTLTPTITANYNINPTIEVGATNATTSLSVTSGSALSITMPTTYTSATLTLKVTAQDGTTTKTYTINITRVLNETTIDQITVDGIDITGSLNTSTFSPQATNNSSVSILVVAEDSNSLVSIAGNTSTKSSAIFDASVVEGANSIVVTIIAADGTVKTYYVSIYRNGTTAAISSLTVEANDIDYTMNVAGTTYSNVNTNTLANSVANISITVHATVGSSITVGTASSTKTGVGTTAIINNSPSNMIAIANGSNYIPVTVTAEDGKTSTTYYVYVYRLNSDATLSGLSLSATTLNEGFTATTLNYTANVESSTSSTKVTATASSTTSTIKINGAVVTSGASSGTISLSSTNLTRETTISIEVIAEDSTTKNYTIVVTRAAYTNASLTSMSLTNAFSSYNSSTNALSGTGLTIADSMNVYVSGLTSSFTISPVVPSIYNTNNIIALSALSNCYIGSGTGTNGNVISGQTATISCATSNQTASFTMTVTAQDGVTKKVYTITINRISNDSSIETLSVDNTILSAVESTYTYVNTTANSVIIVATATNRNSLVSIDSKTAVKGTSTQTVSLVDGDNNILVTTKAEDGTTMNYTVLIHKKYTNTSLTNVVISADNVNYSATLNENVYSNITTNNLSNLTSEVIITPTGSVATTIALGTISSTKTGIGSASIVSGTASSSYTISVGDNYIPMTVTSESGNIATYYVHVYRNAPTVGSVTVSLKSDSYTFATSGDDTNGVSIVLSEFTDAIIGLTGTLTYDADYFTFDSFVLGSGWYSGNSFIENDVEGIINVDLSGLIESSGTSFTAISFYFTTNPNTTQKADVETTFFSPISTGKGVESEDNLLNSSDISLSNVYSFVELSSECSLSGLSVGAGSISPVFDADTSNYTVAVSSSTTTTSVTATSTDAKSTIQLITSQAKTYDLTSGISQTVELTYDASQQSILIVSVTAEDGTQNSYSITLTRALYSVASLLSISLSSDAYSSYSSSNNSLSGSALTISSLMTIYVKATTESFQLTPVVTSGYNIDNTIAIINPNNVTLNTSYVESGTDPLTVSIGSEIISGSFKLVVTAENTTTTTTYTLNIIRLSNDTSLSQLTADTNDIFTYPYAYTTSNNTVAIAARATNSATLISINSQAATTGSVTQNVAFGISNTKSLNIVITAQDGTSETIAVTLTRRSSVTTLSSVSVDTDSGQSYNAVLSGTTYNIPNHLLSDIHNINITAILDSGTMTIGTTSNPTATIGTISFATLSSNVASSDISLSIGANYIPVVVTAENTINTSTYYVYIYVDSNDSKLTALSISASSISPEFDSTTTTYTATALNTTASTTVTATASSANATIKINNASVASGNTSNSIQLDSTTIISITVTAEDGTSTIYTINITKAAYTIATLSSISLEHAYSQFNSTNNTLSGNMLTIANTMNAYLDGNTTSLNIVPNVTANYNINTTIAVATTNATANTIVASGSSLIVQVSALTTNATISLTVTAEDGTTTKTYAINVIRISSDASIDSVLAGDTVLDYDGTSYVLESPTNDNSITIVVHATNAAALVSIDGNAGTKGSSTQTVNLVEGTNVISIGIIAADGTIAGSTTTVTKLRTSTALTDLSIDIESSNYVAELGVNNVYTNVNTSSLSFNTTFVNIIATSALGATMKVGTISSTKTGVGTTTLENGIASLDFNIAVGDNYLPLTVTSESGSSTTYYVYMYRKNNANTLDNLLITQSNGTSITTTYVAATSTYAISNLDRDISTILVTPVVNAVSKVSSITIDGTSYANSAVAVTLNVSNSTITIAILVTPEDVTQKAGTYTLTIDFALIDDSQGTQEEQASEDGFVVANYYIGENVTELNKRYLGITTTVTSTTTTYTAASVSQSVETIYLDLTAPSGTSILYVQMVTEGGLISINKANDGTYPIALNNAGTYTSVYITTYKATSTISTFKIYRNLSLDLNASYSSSDGSEFKGISFYNAQNTQETTFTSEIQSYYINIPDDAMYIRFSNIVVPEGYEFSFTNTSIMTTSEDGTVITILNQHLGSYSFSIVDSLNVRRKYTINVNEISTDASLSDILVTNGSTVLLDTEFASNVYDYVINSNNPEMTSVSISAIPTNEDYFNLTINGKVAESNQAINVAIYNDEATLIRIVVTAEDMSTSVYTIWINYPTSTDSSIKDITAISNLNKSATINHDEDTLVYTISEISTNSDSISLYIITNSTKTKSVEINGTEINKNGNGIFNTRLNLADYTNNTFQMTVEAQDDSTTVYTVNIEYSVELIESIVETIDENQTAWISTLYNADNTAKVGFSADVNEYTIQIAANTKKIVFNLNLPEGSSAVAGNYIVLNGVAEIQYIDQSMIDIVVTDGNGDILTYRYHIYVISNVVSISSLSVNDGVSTSVAVYNAAAKTFTLESSIAATATSLTLHINTLVSQTTSLPANVMVPHAKQVFLNGEEITGTNGVFDGVIDLTDYKSNTITILVVAEDGTSDTFYLKISRLAELQEMLTILGGLSAGLIVMGFGILAALKKLKAGF